MKNNTFEYVVPCHVVNTLFIKHLNCSQSTLHSFIHAMVIRRCNKVKAGIFKKITEGSI